MIVQNIIIQCNHFPSVIDSRKVNFSANFLAVRRLQQGVAKSIVVLGVAKTLSFLFRSHPQIGLDPMGEYGTILNIINDQILVIVTKTEKLFSFLTLLFKSYN